MSRYERTYGTDWTTLGKDEAVERAYALGVEVELGARHPEELDAIRDEMGSAYETSVVELAFEEGRKEVRTVDIDPDREGGVWSELVEEEPVSLAEEDLPQRPPSVVDRTDALDLPDLDSTDIVRPPEFLDPD